MRDDELLFADDQEQAVQTKEEKKKYWKVLIVDDEEGVHLVTKLALEGFEFEGKGLQFLSAYSGSEAIKVMEENPDVAVILLDVVMEEDDAGLKVANYIRNVLKNRITRIILRTGQPGQAPEKEVIINYDINDYKTKTELTAQKLFTTMVAALRSYRDLKVIENSKKGLEKIIEASAKIFEITSFEKFISGVLKQLISFLNLEEDSFYVDTSYFAVNENGELYVVAGTGKFSSVVRKPLKEVVSPEIYSLVLQAIENKKTIYSEKGFVVFFHCRDGKPSIVFIETTVPLEPWKERLFRIFCNNISIALENIFLVEKLVKQKTEMEQMKLALERYLGPQRVKTLKSGKDVFVTEKKHATVMFCDIRGFTDMSANMTPEEVVALLNEFFSRVVNVVFKHGGMLDKFLGDGLLVVFGVPEEFADSEERAVRTALEIKEVVKKWNEGRVKEGKKPIRISIGIHSGDVVAGNIGSVRRMDYTVVGETVNLASRIESLNREFDTDILISKDVYEKVSDVVEVEKQQPVFVKGVEHPIETFRVVDKKEIA